MRRFHPSAVNSLFGGALGSGAAFLGSAALGFFLKKREIIVTLPLKLYSRRISGGCQEFILFFAFLLN